MECRSYGECCVDDVNASHLTTNDLIVHFGRCCLSTSSKQGAKQIVYVLPSDNSKADTWLSELIVKMDGSKVKSGLL